MKTPFCGAIFAFTEAGVGVTLLFVILMRHHACYRKLLQHIHSWWVGVWFLAGSWFPRLAGASRLEEMTVRCAEALMMFSWERCDLSSSQILSQEGHKLFSRYYVTCDFGDLGHDACLGAAVYKDLYCDSTLNYYLLVWDVKGVFFFFNSVLFLFHQLLKINMSQLVSGS